MVARLDWGQDPRRSDALRRGAHVVSEQAPTWDRGRGTIDYYHWLFGSDALSRIGGYAFEHWRDALLHALLPNQQEDGSWPAVDAWSGEGTTVHATLEVTVRRVEEDVTVESFYAVRSEELGDNYRLLSHRSLAELGAISTLYHVETQLADYLERTVYYVSDGKSFVFKFNTRNQVYHAIEPWIDEIVATFFGVDRAEIEAES